MKSRSVQKELDAVEVESKEKLDDLAEVEENKVDTYQSKPSLDNANQIMEVSVQSKEDGLTNFVSKEPKLKKSKQELIEEEKQSVSQYELEKLDTMEELEVQSQQESNVKSSEIQLHFKALSLFSGLWDNQGGRQQQGL